MMKRLGIWVGTTAFCIAAAATELLTVGDPGNPGTAVPFGNTSRPYLRGGVPYTYRIAVKEVSVQEYCDFLNRNSADAAGFYHEDMPIIRSDGKYQPKEGMGAAPMTNVSRVDAARYCNDLSGGEVYRIEERLTEDGKQQAVIGFRDLTSPEAPVLYYLPDMHEFHKAAFYNGSGEYRRVDLTTRNDRSHYGLMNTASGVREWQENRLSEAVIAMGAPEHSTDPDEWNGARLRSWYGDHHRFSDTGFRVAATAPVSVAPQLNRDNNFFGPGSEFATLRIRCERDQAADRIEYHMTDYFGREVTGGTITGVLKSGVNDYRIPLPDHDGYFRLDVRLADGSEYEIPLTMIRTAYAASPDGNFGIVSHVYRWEKGFSREEFDFDRIKQLGAGMIRTDIKPGESEKVFPRIRAAGIRPQAVLPSISTYDQWRREAAPEIKRKWAEHGISPELAGYAELVYGIVERGRDFVSDWELGNEPQGYHVTPEDYAASAKAGAVAIRAAQPDANIILGDMGSLAQPVLSMKTGDFVDAIAVHTYCNYNTRFWGTVGWMRRINGVKKSNQIADKPLWVNEINICTYSAVHLLPLNDLRDVMQYQAMYIPKAMAGVLAYGGPGTKVIPYNFRNVPVESLEGEFGVLDRFGNPKPSFHSYRLTARLLGNARFEGFLKEHSTEIGEISAFGFEDGDRKIAVLWRNDSYAGGDYSRPFSELIGPAASFRIPGEGNAELFTLDGKTTVLTASDGVFTIPVNEYPVFLSGEKLRFETREEQTVRPLPQTEKADFLVQLIPDDENVARALDLMGGYKLSAAIGKTKEFIVRVHNLTPEAKKGTLRLISPEFWWGFNWKFQPEQMNIEIPGNGIFTGKFETVIPDTFRLGTELVLKAVFAPEGGTAVFDSRNICSVEAVLRPGQWVTYCRGWTLGDAQDPGEAWTLESTARPRGGLVLKWNGEHQKFGEASFKNTRILAKNAGELGKRVVVKFGSQKGVIHAVSLLAQDQTGEVFQILKVVPRVPGIQSVEFDCGDFLKNGGFGHYGGNNDGKIDYPLQYRSFIFDLTPEGAKAAQGEIFFVNYDVLSR